MFETVADDPSVTAYVERGAPGFHAFDRATLSPSAWSLSLSKRAFDIFFSLFALVLLMVPLGVIALAIRLMTGDAVLFVQKRVGKGGREFRLFKFRTMVPGADACGPGLTQKGDMRVTQIGRILRKFKLDELPQFFNVLRGDMSLVGPRPKLRIYTEWLNLPYRPGVTGAATLEFNFEEELLQSFSDPAEMESFYRNEIMPLKARLDECYMSVSSFRSDLGMLIDTGWTCLKSRYGKAPSPSKRFAALRRQVEDFLDA